MLFIYFAPQQEQYTATGLLSKGESLQLLSCSVGMLKFSDNFYVLHTPYFWGDPKLFNAEPPLPDMHETCSCKSLPYLDLELKELRILLIFTSPISAFVGTIVT